MPFSCYIKTISRFNSTNGDRNGKFGGKGLGGAAGFKVVGVKEAKSAKYPRLLKKNRN
jgi:hypothetical protein